MNLPNLWLETCMLLIIYIHNLLVSFALYIILTVKVNAYALIILLALSVANNLVQWTLTNPNSMGPRLVRISEIFWISESIEF